jgi:hypothetical protein
MDSRNNGHHFTVLYTPSVPIFGVHRLFVFLTDHIYTKKLENMDPFFSCSVKSQVPLIDPGCLLIANQGAVKIIILNHHYVYICNIKCSTFYILWNLFFSTSEELKLLLGHTFLGIYFLVRWYWIRNILNIKRLKIWGHLFSPIGCFLTYFITMAFNKKNWQGRGLLEIFQMTTHIFTKITKYGPIVIVQRFYWHEIKIPESFYILGK